MATHIELPTHTPFLSQSNFPRVWLAFQHLIGCHRDKLRLHHEVLKGARKIVEIGCSAGTVAELFVGLPEVSYTGVDIDTPAIELARSRFKAHRQMRFECMPVAEMARKEQGTFDLALISGVAHHVDDPTLTDMLSAGARLLKDSGRLVIIDPLIPDRTDSWLVHAFLGLFEQGQNLRTLEDLLDMSKKIEGMSVRSSYVRKMTPNFIFPATVCRFASIELVRHPQSV